MKGLAARTFLAVVAAAVPALAVAGILGATLVAVVADVETDFDTAMSTARKVGEVRVLIEKEHGLVARLPAELDLAKVDGYAGEIAAADRRIAALTAELASNGRVASPHVVAEIDKLRAGIRKATAAIVDATKTFAQSTALDLVKGSFEQDSAVSITLLDAISSNVEAMAAAARARLKASAYWVWRLVPIAFLIAIAAVGLSLWMIRRQVVAPLGRIGAGMRRLADNDPVVDTSNWPVTGELGQMTRAVERFKETAAARERLQTERNVDLQEAEARSRRTAELAVAFQAEAEAVIASLGSRVDRAYGKCQRHDDGGGRQRDPCSGGRRIDGQGQRRGEFGRRCLGGDQRRDQVDFGTHRVGAIDCRRCHDRGAQRV